MMPRPLLLALTCWVAIGASRASLSVYMTPEQLAARSTTIVEGVVIESRSGYDPARRSLATYTTLDIRKVYRGALGQERLVLREPGGRYGDLVHELDAVPVYAAGEQVLVFLEPAPDGVLRTAGMFFGKFRLEQDATEKSLAAVRDLDGQGRILHRPAQRLERFSIADLVAVAATVPATRSRPAIEPLALPPELSRLEWPADEADPAERIVAPAFAGDRLEKFVPLSMSNPTRWNQPDSGTSIPFSIDPRRDPLGHPAAALAEIGRAMAAWTDVPEARLGFRVVDGDYDYAASHSLSPAAAYSGTNIILFGDPYGDIPDPVGCTGVLAVGGYWRTPSSSTVVNGQTFYSALQGYVIFNDGFECFLGDPDNLAEVATHELGHVLGFGHSTAWDSVMQAATGGGRGPRLGDDDRDAAHCHYPHTLSLLSPDGGESWEAGTVQAISWAGSPEDGPDPGTVSLEWSRDGGPWEPIASDQPNDGHYDWLLPKVATSSARVRVVRHNLTVSAPYGYPEACSGDASRETFSVTVPVRVAGSISGRRSPSPLSLDKGPGSVVRLSWMASCSPDANDYAIYAGSLDELRQGLWRPQPLTCRAGADLTEDLDGSGGSHYYLVSPMAGGVEGTFGRDSTGTLRPEPQSTCGLRESFATCRQ